ncbi:MAG: efflux RND transporter permease subunit [Marinicaulis sp.]|nr:efflux RND transporter permease subunit [Marinicaulis sp.]
MHGLIAWWTKNTVAANLLMVACIIGGVAAYFSLEREVFPSASINGADVVVTWPGASPQEMEEQVVLRVEEAVADVDGLEHIDSTAREGIATISIEGSANGDKTTFLNEIKNRVDSISTFPRDVFPPRVEQWRATAPGQFIALYGDIDERELNRLARTYKNEIAQLPNGSTNINLWGEKQEEVSIEISEEALRRYGLTFDEVASAIRGSSLNLAGGQVQTDTGNVQVATRNLADTEEEFARIIVRQQPDGSVIRVGDVATVVDGFEDRKFKREVNGEPSINLAVISPEEVNIVAQSKAIDAWIEEKNEELDGRAEVYKWFDFADVFYERLMLVSSNAAIGLVLVIIVLLLFLRPVVAFWVAAGIAVSFAGAFIFMPAAGVSLNMLSLFAFLLVIGVVVDDAIIVGESIHNQVEEGNEGLNGAVVGAQLVAKPVIFAVLTTMIAFAPWLFMGQTSEFTKHISYTVIFALIFSLVESFFILPAHLSHMKKQDKESKFYAFQGKFADGILTVARVVYRPIIELAIRLRYFTVAIFVVFFAFATALLSQGWVAFSFDPEVQGTFVQLQVNLPEGSPYSRSEQIFDDVERAADKLKEQLPETKSGADYIRSVFIMARQDNVTSYLTIVEANEREESTKQVAEMFREELGPIPDAEEVNIGYTINDNGPEFRYGIQSDDLDELRLATIDMQNFIRTLPGVYDVRNSLQSATPELQIELKPGAERFGLTLAEVSRQIRQAFYGEEVQRLPREGQDVRVMVRYPKSDRESLTTIQTMRIRTADGREVPLTAVADAKLAPSFKRIQRRDRSRSATVSAELTEGTDKAAIMKAFRTTYLPEARSRFPNVQLTRRGSEEAQAEFFAEVVPLYVVALFIMYMLLAIAFSSYWQPVLVMSAIPFGFMGAAFGHLMWGLDFTIFSFFGVGAAAGVVINDNLVLIDYVNRLREKGHGALSALVTAGVGRFRPIVLTSFTTFIGLLPIMYEQSTNAQFLKPVVVALAFGVGFAIFVTLIFVPAMYAVGADIARFYRWAWTGEKQPKVGHKVESFVEDDNNQLPAKPSPRPQPAE